MKLKALLPFVIVLSGYTLSAQNVGIGTVDPDYKLDVQTTMDTSLRISNLGDGTLSTTKTRVGLLNLIDKATAGPRTGILTQIKFPDYDNGPDEDYIAHDMQFSNCFTSEGCSGANIFGTKVIIPQNASTGVHFGIFSDAQGPNNYAGWFEGRGFFSRDLATGFPPTGNERFYAYTTEHPRAARFFAAPQTNTPLDAEGISVTLLGNGQDENIGGRFIVTGTEGDSWGLYSQVNGEGINAGLYTRNLSDEGSRYGVRSTVEGSANGSVYGLSSIVTGNSGTLPTYGLYSYVAPNPGIGSTYGLYVINGTTTDHAAYFVGRTQMVGGTDASLTNHGILQLGNTGSTNVVFDNNEILARTNGAHADLFLQYDGGDVMLCSQEQGGVGIGVLSGGSIPNGYLLAVDGKGIFEEVRVEVSGSWPDYVFKDDYQMPSIPELKSFIDQNGHLPNIPAAKEAEEEGILLGEMQKKLLEKIEELSLYIIQQDERIRLLEEKIENK